MIESIIVSRHEGFIEWLGRRGIVFPTVKRAQIKDVQGKRVFGTLPLRLAAYTDSTVTVYMPKTGEDFSNLTADEMDAAGAYLIAYRVTQIAYHPPVTKPPMTNAQKLGRNDDPGFDLTGD